MVCSSVSELPSGDGQMWSKSPSPGAVKLFLSPIELTALVMTRPPGEQVSLPPMVLGRRKQTFHTSDEIFLPGRATRLVTALQ